VILAAMAMAAAGQFLARWVTVDGVAHRYQVWIPATYDATRQWPAIVFLHGVGERGTDGALQTAVGLGPLLRHRKVDTEVIVVFPQCQDNWVGTGGKIAMAALDQTEREFSVDRSRVALTGMSMGGAGVWALAAQYPDRWSALAPVCAYIHRPSNLPDAGNPTSQPFEEFARRLPRIPIWIFHGSDDDTVPVFESRGMAAALGANAMYTEFPGVEHYAWDPAYMTTDVVGWLIRQQRH
jgi:predicted peptidase